MPDYYKAKIASDEVLSVLGEERRLKDLKEGKKEGFGWIDLRPGVLSGEVETGKVKMGKIGVEGSVSRGDVAEVAVRCEFYFSSSPLPLHFPRPKTPCVPLQDTWYFGVPGTRRINESPPLKISLS